MLDSILSSTPTALEIIIIALMSLLGGIVFAAVYAHFKKKDGYYKDMIISFSLFPFIIAMAVVIVTLLTNEYSGTQLTARIGRVAVALLSAVLILRFRSEQRNFEDLTFMLLLTIYALGTGLGYIGLSLILYFISLAVFAVFNIIGFPKQDKDHLLVSITVPESLNYPDAFEDIFAKYCVSHKLVNVKSTDLGSVFIIKYNVYMKKNASQKEFIDEIRVRNCNLNITVTMNDFNASKK